MKLGAASLCLCNMYIYSTTMIDFLDIRVEIVDKCLTTRLFRKPTAGNSLLHASSAHPAPLKNSIPYGELVRAKRNCSEELTFEEEKTEMVGRFRARGYKDKTIKAAVDKAGTKSRSSLIFEKHTKKSKQSVEGEEAVRFITSYSLDAWKIRKILIKHWQILKADRVIGGLLPHSVTTTYRRSRSLSDDLVHSYPLPSKSGTWLTRKGFYVCGNCKACKTSRNRSEVISTMGQKLTIDKYLTCVSDYCVYVLTCPCGLMYVGSTIFATKKRVLEHRRAIVHRDFTYPVARHFAGSHNGDPDGLSFCAIDRVPPLRRGGDREKRLRILESKHILRLGTKSPYGLNRDEELIVHI